MAERIKILPLVVLAAVVVLGLLLYWVTTRPNSEMDRAALQDAKREIAPTPPPKAAAPTPPKEEPAAQDPGSKILEGADGAFKKGYFETALMFYKDFELRYAGTEIYDQNAIKVFERIHSSAASSEKKDPDLPPYLDTRRRLYEEWKQLRTKVTGSSADALKAELQKYRDALPAKDGRRAVIDGWLAPPKEGK